MHVRNGGGAIENLRSEIDNALMSAVQHQARR
jgi:hypothetical protein